MPKCDFNKVAKQLALQLYSNHTSACVFSKFTAYFQNASSKENRRRAAFLISHH